MEFDHSVPFTYMYGLASLGHVGLGNSPVKNVSLVSHQMPQALLPSPEDKRNDASSFSTKMGNNG